MDSSIPPLLRSATLLNSSQEMVTGNRSDFAGKSIGLGQHAREIKTFCGLLHQTSVTVLSFSKQNLFPPVQHVLLEFFFGIGAFWPYWSIVFSLQSCQVQVSHRLCSGNVVPLPLFHPGTWSAASWGGALLLLLERTVLENDGCRM